MVKEREKFLSDAGRYGIRYEDARKLLRFAATLQRLAEAQCNGDWPYDNGQRETQPCAECESGTVPNQLLKGKRCPDCRTTDRAQAFVKTLETLVTAGSGGPMSVGLTWTAEFQGDPRGAVFSIVRADGVRLAVCS